MAAKGGVSSLAFRFPASTQTRWGYMEMGIENTYLFYEITQAGAVISDVFVISGGAIKTFRKRIVDITSAGRLVERISLAAITADSKLLDKYRLLPLKGHAIRTGGLKFD